MPHLSRRILVSLCPLVNLDLFKKGYYHVACRLVDQSSDSVIKCSEIRDLLGPHLVEFVYPGACITEDKFVTQTVNIEYTEQSFPLGESFIFTSASPIQYDYTEAYVPSHLTLQLELMFSTADELPKGPSEFSCAATRSLSFSIDWRRGLHDYFPVLFDYFHLAAIGVTIHATMFEISLEDFPYRDQSLLLSPRKKISASSRRRSSYQPAPSSPQPPSFPTLTAILFGQELSEADETEAGPEVSYRVPTNQLQRGQDAHHMMCDMLRSARDTLHIAHAIMSGERSAPEPLPEPQDISKATTLDEAELECKKELRFLNSCLASTWEWFCQNAIVHPQMFTFLSGQSHKLKLQYQVESILSNESLMLKDVPNISNPINQSLVAGKVRKSLQVPLTLYCKDNIESAANAGVLFIEPCPWQTVSEIQAGSRPSPPANSGIIKVPGTTPGLEMFPMQIHPFLVNALPRRQRLRRSPGIHLVVCVHGLQGNQYDLRLYRVFLAMVLPQIKFDFLMAQSNHSDTFCDFNVMTDRLLEEVLDYVKQMPTPPSKVSFIGHSLGSVVIRSLVTRPEFSFLQSKLHLLLSICSPHLGTRLQSGIVSLGMWAVRRWYNSVSLLQLSLKDAPNPRDSFLYHLSEAPSLEYFRHIVLLCSPQDKYVPYQSAKIASVSADGSLQSSVCLEMMQNILEPLRQAKVNLVRVSVDHSLSVSANSLIGRAAHIAMLDNELFIEKFVSLHLSQYFLDIAH